MELYENQEELIEVQTLVNGLIQVESNKYQLFFKTTEEYHKFLNDNKFEYVGYETKY